MEEKKDQTFSDVKSYFFGIDFMLECIYICQLSINIIQFSKHFFPLIFIISYFDGSWYYMNLVPDFEVFIFVTFWCEYFMTLIQAKNLWLHLGQMTGTQGWLNTFMDMYTFCAVYESPSLALTKSFCSLQAPFSMLPSSAWHSTCLAPILFLPYL